MLVPGSLCAMALRHSTLSFVQVHASYLFDYERIPGSRPTHDVSRFLLDHPEGLVQKSRDAHERLHLLRRGRNPPAHPSLVRERLRFLLHADSTAFPLQVIALIDVRELPLAYLHCGSASRCRYETW